MTTPIQERATGDGGDEMQRNCRYQSGYCVVLLAASALKAKDYEAVWCEQHEDLLCEVANDTRFDAVQVKTRQPETGYWQVGDRNFTHALERFVALDAKYVGAIRRFVFVSNTRFLDSDATTQAAKSPLHLLLGIKNAANFEALEGDARGAFEKIKDQTESPAEALFAVLKRLDLCVGPPRDAFVSEIAQNHVSRLSDCLELSARRLEHVTNAAIELVTQASALSCQSPERHYTCLNRAGASDPQLQAKRVSVEVFRLTCRDAASVHFRYLDNLTSRPLTVDTKNLRRFYAKLNRGGLSDHAEILRRQTLSAQASLIERAGRDAEGGQVVAQIENAVLAECQEVHLRQPMDGSPYGKSMLIAVQDRLKLLAMSTPTRVHGLSYETLLGMAGLLTEECILWWSERFDVDKS